MNQTHLTIEQLIDYARGELSSREDAVVHAHLAYCVACQEARDAEARLVELLRAHARDEEREMPPGLATAILANAADQSAAAAAATPPFWQRFSQLLRPALVIPMAAALALAAFFMASGFHVRPNGRATDAAAYIENHAALGSTMPFEEAAQGDVAMPTMLTSDETSMTTTTTTTGERPTP
jgi:anti-sigma factor RsiW